MTIQFTDQELKYIEKFLFNWTIRSDCPEELRPGIERKLALMAKHQKDMLKIIDK